MHGGGVTAKRSAPSDREPFPQGPSEGVSQPQRNLEESSPVARHGCPVSPCTPPGGHFLCKRARSQGCARAGDEAGRGTRATGVPGSHTGCDTGCPLGRHGPMAPGDLSCWSLRPAGQTATQRPEAGVQAPSIACSAVSPAAPGRPDSLCERQQTPGLPRRYLPLGNL